MRGLVRPVERSYLSLIPRRNLRRALFLVLALVAVVALKKSGADFFNVLFNSVGSAPPPARSAGAPRPVPETTVHLQLKAPEK
jgi:hypothetical protein